MYNRYIPQPDGSYRRSQVREAPRQPPRQAPQETQQAPQEARQVPREPDPPQAQEPPCNTCIHNTQPRWSVPPRPGKTAPPTHIGTFLKQLLPKDFDTEDLIIVLLLLLMAGDCHEDSNSALLTLVLYLFL